MAVPLLLLAALGIPAAVNLFCSTNQVVPACFSFGENKFLGEKVSESQLHITTYRWNIRVLGLLTRVNNFDRFNFTLQNVVRIFYLLFQFKGHVYHRFVVLRRSPVQKFDMSTGEPQLRTVINVFALSSLVSSLVENWNTTSCEVGR